MLMTIVGISRKRQAAVSSGLVSPKWSAPVYQ